MGRSFSYLVFIYFLLLHIWRKKLRAEIGIYFVSNEFNLLWNWMDLFLNHWFSLNFSFTFVKCYAAVKLMQNTKFIYLNNLIQIVCHISFTSNIFSFKRIDRQNWSKIFYYMLWQKMFLLKYKFNLILCYNIKSVNKNPCQINFFTVLKNVTNDNLPLIL